MQKNETRSMFLKYSKISTQNGHMHTLNLKTIRRKYKIETLGQCHAQDVFGHYHEKTGKKGKTKITSS